MPVGGITDPFTAHGSAVELAGRAVLILGPSKSGKSTLALELMSMGATLVADDMIMLQRAEDCVLVAPPPDSIAGIEASGIGILGAAQSEQARLLLIVDLGQGETERLPPMRKRELLGMEIDLVHGAGNNQLAPAIIQYLKYGRAA